MRLAIDRALNGIHNGQTPFGACIVSRVGKVISCEHNVVWATTDITAHAEMHAIRSACKTQKSIDLSGCTIYSTNEPCPMCFSAIHWAKIKRIVYGTSIADAKAAGFNELIITNTQMRRVGATAINVTQGYLRDECAALFEKWKNGKRARTY